MSKRDLAIRLAQKRIEQLQAIREAREAKLIGNEGTTAALDMMADHPLGFGAFAIAAGILAEGQA